MKNELVEKLVGSDVKDISYWEQKFPPRKEGTIVTRFAPSPTGFAHIGNIYTSMLAEKFAHQNNGVFILRIEDTDGKRRVEGAVDVIVNSLKEFNIHIDEGALDEQGHEKGSYGPYFQSSRQEIYLSGIKHLLEKGLAYPCFTTEEELEQIRKEQTALKLRPGYYGKWAKSRNLTEEQIADNLKTGKTFVFRFKANGDWNQKRFYTDAFRGKISMPENDMDVVILKSDGLPTYHFAHIIDDHFMRTSHVMRTDEWLASLPLHVQMFEAFEWELPSYVHGAPIQKLDDGNKRKLSKRKDPEANVAFYLEEGYPIEAVKEYLMNLLNSNFEDYKKANPVKPLETFELKLENLSVSGPLLDMKKLENISKEFIATLSSSELFNRWYAWAKTYDKALQKRLEDNKEYVLKILGIERDGFEKVRKDFYKMSAIWNDVIYFFEDPRHSEQSEEPTPLNQKLLQDLIASYNEAHTKDEWFENIKRIAEQNGFALNGKDFKAEPQKYKGTISDVAGFFRQQITGRAQTPDLYAIMQILGKEKVLKRLEK